MKIYWLYIFFSGIFQVMAHGQQVLNPVVIDDGLPSLFVTDFARDSMGFMWLATWDGLVRFDGSDVRVWQHERADTGSLPANMITELVYDDQAHTLWLGTEAGLSVFDLHAEHFQNYAFDSLTPPGETGEVQALYLDKDKRLWFSITQFGLASIQLPGYHLALFPLPEKMPLLDQRDHVLDILELSPDPLDEERLWIGTNGGLLGFHKPTGTYQHYYFADPRPETQIYLNQIRGITGHLTGALYLGTWSAGIVRFMPGRSGPETRIIAPGERQRFGSSGTNPPLFPEDENTFWAAMGNTCLFDMQKNQFERCFQFKTPYGKPYPVAFRFKDPDGRIWGASEYGAHVLDPLHNQFSNYQFEAKDPLFYVGGDFIEDPDRGIIFLIYESAEGVFVFDRSTESFDLIQPPAFEASDNGIFRAAGITRLRDDRIWVVEREKIYQLSPETRSLAPVDLPIDTLDALWTSVLCDQAGNLWLGTLKSGLVYLNTGTGEIRTFSGTFKTVDPAWGSWIKYLHQDRHGQIWIRLEYGYSVFDPGQERFDHFPLIESRKFHLSNFVEDEKGNIWCGIEGRGLGRMSVESPGEGILEIRDHKDGLENMAIKRIAMGRHNTLWMLTHGGLQSFSIPTGSCVLYDRADGMITYDPRFHRNPSVLCHIDTLADGTMLYVPRAGLTMFNTGGLHRNTEIPKPYLKAVSSGDSLVRTDVFQHKTHFRFPANAPVIEFQCAAIAYTQADNITWQYLMDDNANNWIDMERNALQLSGLSAGNYHIRLRALNSRKIPSEVLSIHLALVPPWYRSWWFVGLCFLGLAGLSAWMIRTRHMQQMRIRKKEKEIQLLMANLESRTLRTQMNPHFLFNIFNTIQELILTGDTEKAYTYTAKFSRLLRMIMDYSGKEDITLDQERHFLQLYLELESLRFENTFHYILEMEPGLEFHRIPVFLIQPLIENAIRHGLLPKKGEKSLKITFGSNTDHLTCTVIDNGVGLTPGQDDSAPNRIHALELIKKRLQFLEGGRLTMSNHKNGQGVIATIELPFQ